MYLYFAAKVRKSIHIMAYQCIKKQKEGRRSLIYTKKEADSHLPLSVNLTNFYSPIEKNYILNYMC